ncbi:MAG: hypothetical protein EOP49_40160, partial [Sphingobacteriales bacterium]
LLLLPALLAALPLAAQKAAHLKPERSISLDIPEPSDISVAPDGKSYFIVSDNGLLFETDTEGKVIRQADYIGMDNEAVYADDANVYTVEEAVRKLKIFDRATLKLKRTVNLPYSGGRNKGYESFTYDAITRHYIIITEKDPSYIYELDQDFKVVNEVNISKLARDFSSATFHDGFVWLLSDEDRTIFKVDPTFFEVKASWIIPIINPEGIAFDHDGNLLIQSDDMKRLYFFKNPEKQ